MKSQEGYPITFLDSLHLRTDCIHIAPAFMTWRTGIGWVLGPGHSLPHCQVRGTYPTSLQLYTNFTTRRARPANFAQLDLSGAGHDRRLHQIFTFVDSHKSLFNENNIDAAAINITCVKLRQSIRWITASKLMARQPQAHFRFDPSIPL